MWGLGPWRSPSGSTGRSDHSLVSGRAGESIGAGLRIFVVLGGRTSGRRGLMVLTFFVGLHCEEDQGTRWFNIPTGWNKIGVQWQI